MIDFNFAISNPQINNWDRFNLLKSKSGLFKNHKAWEFNTYCDIDIIRVALSLNFNSDHAGLNIKIGLFGYMIEYTIYDTRHWDYDTNTWKVYD